jgi:glycosyltransferase involved in cell wall biosynthesis
MGKVWIVSELYYPEETSTGYFLTKIAEGLAEESSVHVQCSQPTYSGRSRKALKYEERRGVHIHRCWSTTLDKDVLPLRVLNILSITLSFLVNAIRRFRPGDCVLVVTNPPTVPAVIAIASYLRRCRCILIVHDVYPEALIAAGVFRKRSILANTVGWIANILYRQMDRIVVLGRDMASLIEKRLPAGGRRTVSIPNWADLGLVRPMPRKDNRLLLDLGLTSKFVLQYSGNIGRTHGIEQLVNCSERFLEDPSTHFLFIGFGGKKDWLEQSIKERQITNTTLIDYLPRSDLPVSLNACDVAIISFLEGMAGVSVPSRMYNIMAAGKPIIAMADSNSELALVIEEENIGWLVSPGDVDGLCGVIIEAKSNAGLLAEMGRRARKAAEAKYSFEAVKTAYLGLVRSIRPDGD